VVRGFFVHGRAVQLVGNNNLQWNQCSRVSSPCFSVELPIRLTILIGCSNESTTASARSPFCTKALADCCRATATGLVLTHLRVALLPICFANQPCLLKNSISEDSLKKRRARMTYKRSFPISYHFGRPIFGRFSETPTFSTGTAVLDGEIVCLDSAGRSNFADLFYRRREPIFVAFDLLSVGGRDLRAHPPLHASVS
jgi:hypothetical protein